MLGDRRPAVNDAGAVFAQRVRHALRQPAVERGGPIGKPLFHPRGVERRFILPGPHDHRRVIAPLSQQIAGLARRFGGEGFTVVIPPLQWHILPQQHAQFIGLAIQRLAGNVPVHPYRVDVCRAHQQQIPAIKRGGHAAEPR